MFIALLIIYYFTGIFQALQELQLLLWDDGLLPVHSTVPSRAVLSTSTRRVSVLRKQIVLLYAVRTMLCTGPTHTG
jgi:hypothetical protein